MTDTPPADDWWLASDGKFYPPETHPDYVAPPAPPAPPAPAAPAAPPAPIPPVEPTAAGPAGSTDSSDPWAAPLGTPGTASPQGPPAAGPEPSDSRSPLLRFWWLPVLVGIAGIGALLWFGLGGDDDDNISVAAPTATERPEPTGRPTPDEEPTATPEPEEPTTAPEPTATTAPRPTPRPAGALDTTPEGLGTFDEPAAFGEVHGDEEWRHTVLDLLDAEDAGLLASFSDPVPDGSLAVAVVFEMTYVGADLSAQPSLYLEGLASDGETYDTYSGCSLDFDALREQGLDSYYSELVFGQVWVGAQCMFVPEGQVAGLVIAAETFTRFEPVYFSADGGPLPLLEPVELRPGVPDVETRAFGEVVEWEGEWSATIVSIEDPVAKEWISPFAPGPIEGHTFIAAVYEATNLGSDDGFDPFDIAARGTLLHAGSFDCFLDNDALATEGMGGPFDDVPPGETKTSAVCIEVPTEELDELIFRLSNYASFDDDDAYFSG